MNHKRIYRLYGEDGLKLRRKRHKRVAQGRGKLMVSPISINDRWSMDFMSDQLADGRRYRTLNILDDYSRECLAISVGTSLPGSVVVSVLEDVAAISGYPGRVVIDNGPEFTGRALDAWAYKHGITLEYIAPGNPMQNGTAESFNGKFRDECLSRHWFVGLQDARRIIEAWRLDYNEVRPHSCV